MRSIRHGSHRRRLAALFLVVAPLVSVMACGGTDGGDSGEGGMTSVTVGKAVDTIGFTAVDVAIQQGFFEEQGIQAKTVLLAGSSVTNSAMQAGDIQFAAGASLPLLLARQEGLPLVSVVSMDFGVPLQLIVGGSRKEQVSADDSFAERMEALEGAKIGHVSSTDGGFIDLLTERAGMAKGSVQKVTFQSAAAAVTAVEQGAVDAAIGSPPTTLAAVERGKAVVAANAAEVPEYKDMTYDILTTTEEFAAQNKETVKGVATAIAKADNFMEEKANSEDVLALEQEHFPSYSPEVLTQSLDLVEFARDGQQTSERWANAVDTYIAGGQIEPTDAPEGEVWTNEYIDKRALR